ncbi:unnamed protein product [Cuscuta epithymum]|uniref:SP-RING-type domain-containing protein n=1 Tax=Cuscuta epithymum TaxID=186058 RepID=A0AAV0CHI9_9ASTE|nr:unnamed protein product [Cuscuta epithymum]
MAGKGACPPARKAGVCVDGKRSASKPPSNNLPCISAIAERLASLDSSQPLNDGVEFRQLCILLSRGIDNSIASQEIPPDASVLPPLLKQVCRRNNDLPALAAVMALMFSVKSACSTGWFLDKDSEELHHLANEMYSGFCSTTNFRSEPSSCLPAISTIMSRFFPQLRMGHILAFLEIKPGFGAYIYDFFVSRDMRSSPEAVIRLLAAQIDNMETSSCLITPPNVNFLINGKGIKNRSDQSIDTGPQIPTAVADMLVIGVNLLQAVGQFNGSYIIAIASMTMAETPNTITLPDYVQTLSASVDSDSEMIEGPSRISLNCPISFTRIKIPVKGQSCKHLQCFDYDNYLDINSRRPLWRCPHCNQHACFPDIRIDQVMAKVLEQAGEYINDVIISVDGSWKAIIETDDDHQQRPPNKTDDFAKDETLQSDFREVNLKRETIEDLIASAENCQKPDTINLDQAEHSFNMGDFWSRVLHSTYALETSSSTSNEQMGSNPQRTPTNLTNDLVPAYEASSSKTMQSQRIPFENSVANNEYGRSPSITRYAVSRTPIAVQALPAQTRSPLRPPVNTMNSLHSFPSGTSRHSPSIPLLRSTGMTPPGYSFSGTPYAAQQQFVDLQCQNQVPVPFRAPSGFTGEPTSTTQHRTPNMQPLNATSQSQGITHSCVQQARRDVHSQHNQATEAAMRISQVAKPVQLSTAPPHPRPNVPRESLASTEMVGNIGGHLPLHSQSDQNWRPSGRMRGSLLGEAYNDALNHYMVLPTQQAQASRSTSAISPQLQTILAKRVTSTPIADQPAPATTSHASSSLP